jgi:hypothetical protein
MTAFSIIKHLNLRTTEIAHKGNNSEKERNLSKGGWYQNLTTYMLALIPARGTLGMKNY